MIDVRWERHEDYRLPVVIVTIDERVHVLSEADSLLLHQQLGYALMDLDLVRRETEKIRQGVKVHSIKDLLD